MRRNALIALLLLSGCSTRSNGWWIDEEAGCVVEDEHRRPAGACGDAAVLAIAPDGTCWMFPSTCVPASFEAIWGGDGECTYERFEELPPCE